jgi:cytochrome b561
MQNHKQPQPPATTADTARNGSASHRIHFASIVLMGVLVSGATADGFAQSYAGLYHWALEHSLHGWKAQSFPLMVDLFIGVGELGLFALALEGHKLTRRFLSWADLALAGGIAAAGWGVSLAFNVGSVGGHLSDRLTAAVPPVASMLGLVVLLRTLHRLVGRLRQLEPQAVEPVEQVPLERVAEVEVERVFNRPQLGPAGDGDADQPVFIPLEHAVMSARAAGMSQQAIATAYKITKYQVQKIEKEQASTADSATVDDSDEQCVGAA